MLELKLSHSFGEVGVESVVIIIRVFFCFIQNIHTENVHRELLTQSYRGIFESSPYLTFVAQLSSVLL